MPFRTWPVAALGLCALLLLIVVSVLTAARRAQEISTQIDRLNTHHREVEERLQRLRSDVNLSGIFVRDYLLDQEGQRADASRERLTTFRNGIATTLDELRTLIGHDDPRVSNLGKNLDEFWRSLEPLFDWTPAEKRTRSATFLRQLVLPRREAVLGIAEEIEGLNDSNLTARQDGVLKGRTEFRSHLYTLLWQSLLLGILVAVSVVIRLRVLERRSEEQRMQTEAAERQMRELSQQLVATQEEERKKLSRELHDHVGQVLTALRIELGRIERLRVPTNTPVAHAVAESRELVDNVVRTVRDLALGLRPSMLDDFGLQPALEWLVRDFTRRYGLIVDLTIEGNLDDLPDQHRTCIYRVVQEALTNCVRHSGASSVEVAVHQAPGELIVSIADDGVGLAETRRKSGLGLRGMEERVKELRGSLSIATTPATGTTLTIRLPFPVHSEGVTLARAAG